MSDTREIRGRIARIGVTHRRVAVLSGYDHTAFSRWLAGYRQPPKAFFEKVTQTLDALETAEMAADEARRKVLQRAGLAS